MADAHELDLGPAIDKHGVGIGLQEFVSGQWIERLHGFIRKFELGPL
jgi:hypothetical protein